MGTGSRVTFAPVAEPSNPTIAAATGPRTIAVTMASRNIRLRPVRMSPPAISTSLALYVEPAAQAVIDEADRDRVAEAEGDGEGHGHQRQHEHVAGEDGEHHPGSSQDTDQLPARDLEPERRHRDHDEAPHREDAQGRAVHRSQDAHRWRIASTRGLLPFDPLPDIDQR